jgi:FtsP/CotA-like multicopper oxidase with cupredoxin domain
MDNETKMDRREFLRVGARSGVMLAGGSSALLNACVSSGADPLGPDGARYGVLYHPPRVRPEGLRLTGRATTAEIAPGLDSPILSWGDGPVGPTIEARTGQRVTILMQNELSEPTIAHWHGLRPPEAMDGHPRFAVGPGRSYAYDFEVGERAGTYWYHSHAHMRTGPQIYYGLAGLFIVRDDIEAVLDLPAAERELLLVLQDKRQDGAGRLVYSAAGHDMMEGFLGDTPFVNGVRSPRVEVDSAQYRLRVLVAANARIYRLALSNGAPLVMIGTDGGLLEQPVELPYVDLGTGERVDLLVDFSGLAAGATVRLKSLAFPRPAGGMGGMGMGGMGRMGGQGLPQGSEFDVLEFVVSREVREEQPIPGSLATLARLHRSEASRERVFRFDSRMMNHAINGRRYEMERVDERVPFGSTEIWRFVNDSPFPHPVHMHAVHFQVLSRTGGRGSVLPWEQGWKDTVLVYPGEQVEVIARFDAHRGVFMLHCHNLEHEDMGMMMNFAIE